MSRCSVASAAWIVVLAGAPAQEDQPTVLHGPADACIRVLPFDLVHVVSGVSATSAAMGFDSAAIDASGTGLHGFQGRANAIGAHFLRPLATGAGQDLGDGQPAHPALARSHAAAAEELGLVRPLAAQTCHLADAPGRQLFTTTDHRLIAGIGDPIGRPVQRVEEGADAPLLQQRSAQRRSATFALGRAQSAQCRRAWR